MNMTFLLLQIMQAMEITAGLSAHQYATRANERRIAQVKRIVREMTKKARMRRRQAKLNLTGTNYYIIRFIQPWIDSSM